MMFCAVPLHFKSNNKENIFAISIGIIHHKINVLCFVPSLVKKKNIYESYKLKKQIHRIAAK